MKKIVVAGYHGYENAGDDATLITIINNIKKSEEDVNIVVLSKNPTLTKNVYGVKAIYRFNPFLAVWHIMTAHAVILGGGSLIQDSTSSRSNSYYLGIIMIAKFFMKRVMLYSNGMGPLTIEKNIKKASKVLNKVDVITLREKYAKKFLDDIGVNKPEIVVTADPAFNLGYMIEKGKGSKILERENISAKNKIVGVCIRECSNKENYIKQIACICDYMIEQYGVDILFIPFQHAVDLKVSNETMNIMKNKAYVLTEKCQVSDILNVIAECHMIIGMRLHSIIFAALSGVPVLGIAYDPKVKYYLEILDAPNLGTNQNLNFEECKNDIDGLVKNYDNIRKKLDEKVVTLINNTMQNEVLIKKIIKK